MPPCPGGLDSSISGLDTNVDNLTRTYRRQRSSDARHQGPKIGDAIRSSVDDNDRDPNCGQVLLEAQIAIDGDEVGEARRHHTPQEISVAPAKPALIGDG